MAVQRPVASAGLRHSQWAAALMLLGLVATYLPLPLVLFALVPLALAVWESVRAIRSYRTEKAPRRLVVWTAFGLLLTGVLVISVLLPFAFYPAAKDYQDCMDGANTSAARAECRRNLTGGAGSFFGQIMQPR